MQTATLVNFKEKFRTPPPAWFREIKQEAYKRIAESPSAEACRKGDREVMKKIIVNLWPFVDIFPRLVGQKYLYLFTNPSMYFQHGPLQMLSLGYYTATFLKSIAKDEKSHRLLWLDSGSALGLEYPKDYEVPITPQTREWRDDVANQTEPSEMLFGYVAIEIIAESVSKNLIDFEPFKLLLGDKGLRWFGVHTINHGDVSHENLELQLALTFHKQPDVMTRQSAENTIMRIVDKFLAAANACV